MNEFAKLLATVVLVTFSLGCGGKPDKPKKEMTADAVSTGKAEGKVHIARSEITFEIRDPENRGAAVLVRLNPDRLRVYDLSKEDVLAAMTPSGLNGFEKPSSGVVFNSLHFRPDQYEQVLLKANAEGEIVRLKDVATVELLAGRETQDAKPNAGADGGDK